MGAAVGLGINVGIASHPAEASTFPTALYFQEAQKHDAYATQQLLEHIPEWAMDPEAEKIAQFLAKKFPHDFIHHTSDFLRADIFWGQPALSSAIQSMDPNSTSRDIFVDLDVTDPYVFSAIEASMDTMYHNVFEHYWYRDTLTHKTKPLLRQAILLESAKHPLNFLQAWDRTQEPFTLAVPDPKERERILTDATLHAISESPESLLEVGYIAEHSSTMKKVVTEAYGWDRFLDRFVAEDPEVVFRSIRSESPVFSSFTSGKKRIKLLRSASTKAPLWTIGYWKGSSTLEVPFTHAELAELEPYVNDAYTEVLTKHLPKISFHLSSEDIHKFSGIRRGLALASQNNPLVFLKTFNTYSPPELLPYREAAAEQVVTRKMWMGSTPDVNAREGAVFSHSLFDGLPEEERLKRQWVLGTIADPSYSTEALSLLLEHRSRSNWPEQFKPQALMLALAHRSEKKLYADLPLQHLTPADIQLILSSVAKDNFTHALGISESLQSTKSIDSYLLLYTLEQAQPYEYAKWIRDIESGSTPSVWKEKVTPHQWDSLKVHAANIEGDKVTYAKTAESMAYKGLRFTPEILEDVHGMNYHHKLKTTVAATDKKPAIAGEQFITIPMLAFETIVTSPSFNTYIDSHADGTVSFVNLCSMAQATFRRLIDLQLLVTNENIATAIRDIDSQWNAVKHTEIFGPNTKLIVGGGEETRFNNQAIIDQLLVRHGGDAKNVLYSGKGSVQKRALLDAISHVHTGSATIVLDGHGSTDKFYLDDDTFISAAELGEALRRSQNVPNLRLFLGGCSGYDFAEHLLRFLRMSNVDTTGMILITAANDDALAFGGGVENVDSKFLSTVSEHNPGKPITLETFRQVEHKVWQNHDPSITIGLPISSGWMTGIEVADTQE